MKHLISAVLCAASLAAVSAPVSATQIIVTYAGTVKKNNSAYQSIDVDGLFGAAGANLKKQAYTLSFTTDTSGFSSEINETYGYSRANYCCSVTAVMTIVGISYTIDTVTTDSSIAQWIVDDWNAPGYQINATTVGTNGDLAVGNVAAFSNFFGDLGLTTPLSYTLSHDDGYAGIFIGKNTELDLDISNISVEVVASPTAAPEPASWAMMIGGFGAIGLTMRRRRTAVRFA